VINIEKNTETQIEKKFFFFGKKKKNIAKEKEPNY